MSCKKWRNLIMKKIDGTTNDIENQNLSLHLEGCPICRNLEQDLKRVLAELEEEPPLDLEIDPMLEVKVMQMIRHKEMRTTIYNEYVWLAGVGLILLLMAVLLGGSLENFSFFNLFLKAGRQLSQITNILTKLEIVYSIIRPFVFQGLNTIAQWVLAIYKGSVLVAMILLIRFISIQKNCGD
ncbi:MAG: zf-HC2 domain-containing protein [Firmicutes bacterium]|nr:zf-HC2 domain-containing protein [Bacillota bacterium]